MRDTIVRRSRERKIQKQLNQEFYEKKFNELNAEGNDKDLATNGYEPGYWYSVGDGYRLLLSMRQQFLKYNYNDMIVKQGEEYAVHQENEQRIFLLDPYYGEFGAFANQLEDDVYFIATGKKKENGKDVNMSTEPKPWTQMPTTLIIPILTGTEYSPHWRSIKVDVDYENKTYEMLFDDPYGMGYFPEELKNEIIKSLKPNIKLLIETQTKEQDIVLSEPKTQEKQKKQQDNGYDCGPITFRNIRDYVEVKVNNVLVKYTISEVNNLNHDKLIKEIREADIQTYSEISGIPKTIFEERQNEIKEQQQKSFKELIEKAKSLNLLETKLSSMTSQDIDKVFQVLENSRIVGTSSESGEYTKTEQEYALQVVLQETGNKNSNFLNKTKESKISKNKPTTEKLKTAEEIKEQDKIKDISKLKKMLELIEQFEQEKLTLEKTLIGIGDLAGGENKLLHNDRNDKDSYYIRNKYGYIQRNNSNEINPNGIYFEKLYHLKVILEHKDFIVTTESLNLELKPTNFSRDFESKTKQLESDLSNLKQKIIYILNQEKDFIESKNNKLLQQIAPLNLGNDISNPEISNIIDFSRSHYEQIILKRIKEELDQFENIDFSIREDRYHFARIFTIIGELLHEFTEGKIMQEGSLLRAFENLAQIRNILIHCHIKTWLGVKDNKEAEIINQIIIELIENLRTVITIDTNNENSLRVNYEDNKIAQFLEKNSELLKKIFKGTYLTTEIIESVPSEIVEQKKTYIKTPEEIEKEKTINKLKSLIVQASKAVEAEGQSITDDTTQKKQKFSLSDFLNKLNKQYQISLKKLDNSEQKDYPSSLSLETKKELAEFSNLVKKTSEEKQEEYKQQEVNSLLEKKVFKKQELVSKTIHKVDKEISYLKEIEQNSQISQVKKEYVIQHIVSVIGQYMRDIEEFDTTKFIPTISSVLVEEASISTKSARNEGLAHNISSLDLKKLAERVQNDILPAHEHFQSIFTIYEHQHGNVSISVITLNHIGASFLKLGLYYEAIDYFNKTIEYINDHPKAIDEIKLLSVEITQEHGNVKVIDFGQELFGIESYSFIAQKNLANAYLLTGDYNKAYKVLISIIDKMDFSNLELASENFLANIAEIFNNTACCLGSQDSYKEALELCEKANLILQDDCRTKINLASFYRKLNHHDKANELLESILKNPDPVIKFNALEHYVCLLSDNPDKQEAIEEVSKYITEMESILKTNIDDFKKEYSDKYLLLQLTPIALQIQIISEKAQLTHKGKTLYNFSTLQSELEKFEEEFNFIIDKVKNDLQNNEKIASIYTAFSCCFSSIITNQSSNSNNEMKKLKKAQDYFDKAIKANCSQEILIHTADNMAKGYSNYSLWYIEKAELRIKFLERALEIQEKYETAKFTTLINIGTEYHNLGEDYLFGLKGYKKSFDDAFSNYNKAIPYLTQTINTNSNTELTKVSLVETLRVLAMSYEGVGYLRYDIISMQKAMLYYKEAIKLSVTQEIIRPQQECKQKISSIETMLKSIQNKLNTIEIGKISPQDVIAVEISVSEIESYAFSFYKEKLPIQGFKIRDKNCIIFLNGKTAIEKFKNHIQQELEYFYDKQELQNIACDEQLSKQEALIEERIISQFEKFKTSQNDVIIQITTKGIERTDLEHYCQSQLSINSTDLEFDKNTCWITLNKENVEILRNKLSNHDGLGMTNHEVSSYWNQYSKQGMKELLKLRLENIEAEEVEIISPNYVWDDSFSSAERLINEIIYSLGVQDKVLICLNLYNKHWVGLAIDKTSNKINISYMDSEQQKIPLLLKDKFIEALAIACPKHQINITEIEIELQRYNNCGPETIENFIAYLNGNRVSQEDAVLLHSQLLENELLFDNTQILGSNTILSTTDLF